MLFTHRSVNSTPPAVIFLCRLMILKTPVSSRNTNPQKQPYVDKSYSNFRLRNYAAWQVWCQITIECNSQVPEGKYSIDFHHRGDDFKDNSKTFKTDLLLFKHIISFNCAV